MFGLGATEVIVILVIALLVLGPKRLPDAARSLGRGMAEFRRASAELRNAISQPLEEPEPGMPATVPATVRHLPDTAHIESKTEPKTEAKPADPHPSQDA